MSEKLTTLWCEADFPDDDIWDDDDNLVRTNGLNTATAVAELLKSEGMELEGPIEHPEHGWELLIKWRNQHFWVQVTVAEADDVLILTSHSYSFWRFRRKNSQYPEFLQILHNRLEADGRFHKLRWQPWIKNDDLPGALSPTSPYPGSE
jgi:hypothetical protein